MLQVEPQRLINSSVKVKDQVTEGLHGGGSFSLR